MDFEQRKIILEHSFKIMEEILNNNNFEDELDMRKKIKNDLQNRLNNVKDPLEKAAIVDAYSKMKSLSFDEIQELANLIEPECEIDDEDDDDLYYEDIPLRRKIMEYKVGDKFFLQYEDNQEEFELLLRFIYNEKYYVLLLQTTSENDNFNNHVYCEFIYGDDLCDDKIIFVNDKSLINELDKKVKDLL